MLDNFFRLNGACDEFRHVDDLKYALRNSNDLRHVVFFPGSLTFEDLDWQRDSFTNITFNNVSFSITDISGITFRGCTFEDCLFMSTRFINCEFHNCKFIGCNPQKIEFINTYIDPEVFVGMIDEVKHSNIGIHLFQRLYKNAMETEQPKFVRTAEFNMRKWERYDLNYKYPGWNKFRGACFRIWSTNILSYLFVGYGLRAKFWFFWAVLMGVFWVTANYFLWDCLDVVGRDDMAIKRNLIDVLFYTVTTLGGSGDLVPRSDVGKLLFLFQAGVGLFIVGLSLRWLVRLAIR